MPQQLNPADRAVTVLQWCFISILFVWSARIARADLAAWASLERTSTTLVSAESGELPIALHSLAGADPWGRIILRSPPKGVSRFIVFVLHGASLQRDLEFWHAVSADLRAQRASGYALLAYCDSDNCSAQVKARGRQSKPAFPILAQGVPDALEVVRDADNKGAAVVVDKLSYTVGRLPWRRGQSASEIAAAAARIP